MNGEGSWSSLVCFQAIHIYNSKDTPFIVLSLVHSLNLQSHKLDISHFSKPFDDVALRICPFFPCFHLYSSLLRLILLTLDVPVSVSSTKPSSLQGSLPYISHLCILSLIGSLALVVPLYKYRADKQMVSAADQKLLKYEMRMDHSK